MKSTRRWIAMATALVLGTATAQATDQEIAFIDLDKVFNEYGKTQVADAELKERADDFNEERHEMIEQFKELQDTFNGAREDAQNTALKEELRQQRRDEAEEHLLELREQESRIRRFDEARKKQLDEQGARMRNRIVEEILDVIQDYASDEGYSAVIDISGESLNAVTIVLYADPKIDITDDVIQMLNKSAE